MGATDTMLDAADVAAEAIIALIAERPHPRQEKIERALREWANAQLANKPYAAWDASETLTNLLAEKT